MLQTRIYASVQNWKTSVVLSFLFVTLRCVLLSECLRYDHCTLHQSYRAERYALPVPAVWSAHVASITPSCNGIGKNITAPYGLNMVHCKLRQTNAMYSVQNAIPMAFNHVFPFGLNCPSMIACAAFATVVLSWAAKIVNFSLPPAQRPTRQNMRRGQCRQAYGCDTCVS